jgi:putative transposase
MKRVSPYLKMRVLGAIEFAPGNSIVARIRHISSQVFTDDNDQRCQFTWRTIQTWYSRYKKDGITSMHPRARSDKGHLRKVQPELLAEAIDQVRANFHANPNNITAVYRACIERGLLLREQVAPNTFRRIVRSYELFKPIRESNDKRRLAFAKAHANEMWQADTMFGPYVQHQGSRAQSKLIAFIDSCGAPRYVELAPEPGVFAQVCSA